MKEKREKIKGDENIKKSGNEQMKQLIILGQEERLKRGVQKNSETKKKLEN